MCETLIERILNKPIDSNSYVVYKNNCKSSLIIDPGTEDCSELICFIEKKRLMPELILLTHEHFDHIWGVEKLRKKYKCKLVASIECSDAIQHPKKNLSLFHNQKGFKCNKTDISFYREEISLFWNGCKTILFKTPGHSDGSICILIDDHLFTGDTIIRKTKTALKLPGGNKEKLINSIRKITSYSKQFDKVCPGHGESFSKEEFLENDYCPL